MHFGAWHPIQEALVTAPEAAGVFQTRAEGILDYDTGRSAMVLYACSAAQESLRAYLAGRGARELRRAMGAGARWIRFAVTTEPEQELDRLLHTFASRFGGPPISNTAGKRVAPTRE